MANIPIKVGTLKRTSVTNYYEQNCYNIDPHPRHRLGVSGSGGGASFNNGPVSGTHEIDNGVTNETWCPGIRGLMRV